MSLKDKLANRDGPHKLLALDGGGIRGVITLEVLARMESLLQLSLGRDDTFVLADYFDYFAGTSTGGIIATFLSLGKRVDWIRKFYLESGKEIFQQAPWRSRLRYKFTHRKLEALLKREIGEDTELGSDRLKTLLMLVMRNHDSDSPWPISNNPWAKYNNIERPDCNLKIPLWELVRASAAAPTYFEEKTIKVGNRNYVFVDGGVTMYNNPAFQLFLMATVDPYNLCWPTGETNMLLISIGTGTSASVTMSREQMNLLFHARSIPAALMYAALNEQDMLCRVFGKCLFGARIDGEIGDLRGLKQPVDPKLFTYVRYNADLSRKGLSELGLTHIEPEHVQKLDAVDATGDLQLIGEAVGRQVEISHFADFLE